MTPEPAACPLCRADAEYVQLDIVRKHFKCPECFEFVLWRDAELQMPRRAQTTTERFAGEAKATTHPDFVYVISGRTPGADPAHVDLVGRAQLRSIALAP